MADGRLAGPNPTVHSNLPPHRGPWSSIYGKTKTLSPELVPRPLQPRNEFSQSLHRY